MTVTGSSRRIESLTAGRRGPGGEDAVARRIRDRCITARGDAIRALPCSLVLLLTLLSAAPVSAAATDVADAAMRGDRAAVRAALARKADVNAPQADGTTALHWAVEQ